MYVLSGLLLNFVVNFASVYRKHQYQMMQAQRRLTALEERCLLEWLLRRICHLDLQVAIGGLLHFLFTV